MEMSDAVKVVVQVLGPSIGETMARSATEAHCEKLGIAEGSISSAQTEALLAKLSGGLNIFLGRDKAAAAIAEVRNAMRLREAGR